MKQEVVKHSVEILTSYNKDELQIKINEYLRTPGWVIVNNSFSVNDVPGGGGIQYTIMMLYTETEVRDL